MTSVLKLPLQISPNLTSAIRSKPKPPLPRELRKCATKPYFTVQTQEQRLNSQALLPKPRKKSSKLAAAVSTDPSSGSLKVDPAVNRLARKAKALKSTATQSIQLKNKFVSRGGTGQLIRSSSCGSSVPAKTKKIIQSVMPQDDQDTPDEHPEPSIRDDIVEQGQQQVTPRINNKAGRDPRDIINRNQKTKNKNAASKGSKNCGIFGIENFLTKGCDADYYPDDPPGHRSRLMKVSSIALPSTASMVQKFQQPSRTTLQLTSGSLQLARTLSSQEKNRTSKVSTKYPKISRKDSLDKFGGSNPKLQKNRKKVKSRKHNSFQQIVLDTSRTLSRHPSRCVISTSTDLKLPARKLMRNAACSSDPEMALPGFRLSLRKSDEEGSPSIRDDEGWAGEQIGRLFERTRTVLQSYKRKCDSLTKKNSKLRGAIKTLKQQRRSKRA